MKKYFLLSLVLLPAIVLGAVTPNVTNLASFSKEQLIKVIECMVKPESAGSLKFCLEQIGGPVITSYNQTIDINGTIDIKGKNFGTKVRVELAVIQGQGQGQDASNYRKAIDLNTTLAGTAVTVPLSKLITTEKDKAMFVGNYNTMLNVTRLSDGVIASAGYINITEDLVADKVVIGEGAKLTKALVNGKETLVATFSVTLRSEKKSATTIPKADPFGVIAYNPLPKAGSPAYTVDGPHDAFSKNTYVKTAGEAVDYGNYYIIPEGKSATFRVTANFNPLSMFGGNYVAKVRSISYGDSVGKWAIQILGDKTPRNKTNAVVIVGEKSPYIISATPSKEIPTNWNGVLTLKGVRFSKQSSVYLVNNASGQSTGAVSVSATSSTEMLVDTTKFTVSSGYYDLFIKDSVTGESNRVGALVKGSTTSPGDETGSLNCPTLTGYTFTKNLAVGSTDSPDVLALQCFLISKGHLASTVKSGYFGALTKAALIKYQQSKGEEVATGYFGPVTRAVVNADLASTPTVSTTTATSLIIEKVSTSVSQELGSDSTTSDDRGVYKFTFKVRPVGGGAYIPLTAIRSVGSPSVLAGVNFSVEDEDNFTATSGQATASLSQVSGGDRIGNYVKIEEDETVTFVLTASFDASLNDYYKLQMLNVGYSGTASTPTRSQDALPVENFETSVVEVKADAGTQSRNTASVWQAVKSFFK